jgi:hypothetical protein
MTRAILSSVLSDLYNESSKKEKAHWAFPRCSVSNSVRLILFGYCNERAS